MRERCVLTATATSHLSRFDQRRLRIRVTYVGAYGHQNCGRAMHTARSLTFVPVPPPAIGAHGGFTGLPLRCTSFAIAVRVRPTSLLSP